ncbi:hypothetical protein A2U01_0052259 [Trifolium medium]|uniref:Uncharacterized protein n=1 Tax=Trifolium medium TaxID=97028 RepID=A0A392R374_9FABA|nr:hypothetical protein [Trifolium medium]
MKNRIPDPPVEEGIYSAPSAGPKVPVMGRVEQPTKSDCQDFSLDGGRGCYFALILVELFHVSRGSGYALLTTCPCDEEHV